MAEVNELQNEINNATSELHRQKEELNGSNQSVSLIKKNILALQEKLLGVCKEKEEMQNLLDLKEKEAKFLGKQINALEDTLDELEDKVREAEYIILDEINKSKIKLEALDQTCNAKDTEISYLKARLLETENQANKIRREKDQTDDSFAMHKLETATKINNLRSSLMFKEEELNAQRAKIEEYAKKLGDIERVCFEMHRKSLQTAENMRYEEKIIEEPTLCTGDTEKKEQIYKSGLDEIREQLNDALEQVARNSQNHKDLLNKYESIERQLEKKSETVKESNENIFIMKNKLDAYMGRSIQLSDTEIIKQENSRLRNELKKQNELINNLNKKARETFQVQEEEINKVREACLKSENQQRFIMSSATIKENEAAKYKEEVKLVLLEKTKLSDEIKE